MRTPTTLIATLAVMLAFAAPAMATPADDTIVHDCQHSQTGALTGTYPKAQLKHALHNLPGDVAEYTGCYDAIRQALLSSGNAGGGNAGGGNGTGSGSTGGDTTGGTGSSGSNGTTGAGAAPSGPEHVGTKAPVALAGAAVHPGALPALGHDTRSLPTPLVVLLILLAVAALVPAVTILGRRVVARHRT